MPSGIAEKRFQFGNMMLSRWKILSIRNRLLPRQTGIVVMGDFNMRPGSEEYAAMLGVSGSAFVDVSAADSGNSFLDPSEEEREQRLDYVFSDRRTARRVSNFRIDRDAAGSDHLPLFFALA
jgi:endonuclease/exonuclease/phosphatase family metal-dependent hydrolase